jgi:hypothetical protein
MLLNPDRPARVDPVDPGPGPVRATQKTGARKKLARPGLTRVRPGLYILTHLSREIWESKRKAKFLP